MKTQLEFLQEIIDLKNKNPETEIRFCVNNEELAEDGRWTAHIIYKVEISPWYIDGGVIMTDEDAIKEAIADDHWDDELNENELDKLVEKIYNTQIKYMICVYTGAG